MIGLESRDNTGLVTPFVVQGPPNFLFEHRYGSSSTGPLGQKIRVPVRSMRENTGIQCFPFGSFWRQENGSTTI